MTDDERVQALGFLGFTPRQTRFLATVALHSGFCLRRQYATFAGIEYGKNVRDFLDHLVARRFARRLQVEVNRGHVYHLTWRPMYRALGQEDNRNRRATAPALIARKLMLLDFALTQSADEWIVTEQDKVALCRDRFHIAQPHLPRRVYAALDPSQEPSARYFLDKLPLFLAGHPPVVHLVYLATDRHTPGFLRFLRDHRGLLARLPRWAVVLVHPPATVDTTVFQATFEAFLNESGRPHSLTAMADLRWYFQTRLAAEQDNLPTLSPQLIARFQAARRRFAGAGFEGLYAEWGARGDAVFDASPGSGRETFQALGTLRTCELPFTYTQFGSRPGVA